jgi:glycosyltransferase involved in cell wall biosynthesis
MRILFLTSETPYPADDGGRIKTLSILEYLRPHHELTVFCFRRQELSEAEARWIEEFGQVTTTPLRLPRSPLNLVRSYLSGLPLSIWRNRSATMRTAVEDALSASVFDCVFIDHWLMAQYLPKNFAGLKLLHEHNAEYVMWQRQTELERNPMRRAVVSLEAGRVRRYEAGILTQFDITFAVSKADREALIALGAEPSRTLLLPNLPDPGLLARDALEFMNVGPVILYFGTLSWQPNIEGLEYFIRSVLPLIRRAVPEARLLISGKGAPARLVRLAESEGVAYLGPAADSEVLYQQARVFIETTRSGGGTKIKLLNALARGLPVVATPEALGGLEVSPGDHLLAGGDAAELADAVVRLLNDADLCHRLSESGRTLIRTRYTADKAYSALDEALTGAGARA